MSRLSAQIPLCTRHRSPLGGVHANDVTLDSGAPYSISPTSPPPTPPPATSSASLHPLTVSQPLVDTKKYFCPFLVRGYCREADSCKFSHDNVVALKIPHEYCHFYLANQCLYGQECKFRHSEPTAQPSAGSTSTADQQAAFCDQFPSTSLLAAQGTPADTYALPGQNLPLCPYSSTTGICQFPAGQCSYLHGLDCDLCGRACLHPYDPEQQRQHRDECLREHEREMELSFAVQRSKDKVCGICMDTVVEKKPVTSSRFGILEKCNHIFCLDCIRKWRGTKQFETRTIRACPECRVSSDFVVPSKYWVEDQDDKEKLITDYKSALRSKPCKYFDEGKGDCPFAGSCFYRHAYPDGRIAKEDTPKPRRRVYGARGPTTTEANYILWNILTSTGDDDGISFAEYESLYVDPDYMSSDEDDLDEDDLEGHLYL